MNTDAINNIINNTNQVYNQNSKTGNSSLSKDDFLRLLMTQLQNQDPTNPMDSQQFAAQLAQFNTVEQLTNLNSGMTSLNKTQQSVGQALSNTMAASLTGKVVKGRSDALQVTPGQNTDVKFNLSNTAADVKLTITDSSGNVVRTADLKNRGAGDQSWTWDGKNDSGSQLPAGTYHVSIDASNGSSKVNSYSYIQGKVSQVQYSKSGVTLLVNGVGISMGNIESVSDPSSIGQ